MEIILLLLLLAAAFGAMLLVIGRSIERAEAAVERVLGMIVNKHSQRRFVRLRQSQGQTKSSD